MIPGHWKNRGSQARLLQPPLNFGKNKKEWPTSSLEFKRSLLPEYHGYWRDNGRLHKAMPPMIMNDINLDKKSHRFDCELPIYSKHNLKNKNFDPQWVAMKKNGANSTSDYGYPQSVTRKDYQRSDASLEPPTEHRKRYGAAMSKDREFKAEHEAMYDHRDISRTLLGTPFSARGYRESKCKSLDYEVNVQEAIKDGRLLPVRTASQEHDFTVKKIEQDAKLLEWKEWQLYSQPKLLHKYPGYIREHHDRALLPYKPGDPPVVPFKHRKAFDRVLRFRHTDQAHHDSEMRTKLLGLRVPHHHDGYEIKKYLNS